MRTNPRLRPARRAGWWLILLLAGGPVSVHAASPPPTGVILGTVVRASDGAPVPYANVVETTSRIGTTTDERGGFRLTGLPVGPVAIRVQAFGGAPLVETVELAPGDTVRRTYRLVPASQERFRQIRDSLAARGQWPPTLDPILLAHMREALDVRVFRLDPEHPVSDAPTDPKRRIGPWPIVGEARRPALAVLQELVETLRETELYLSDLQGAKKLCGGFSPGIDVRFTDTGVTTDLLLCYGCGEFEIWSGGGARQTGDFESRAPDFVRFAKRMFPDDPVIRKLGSRAKRPSR